MELLRRAHVGTCMSGDYHRWMACWCLLARGIVLHLCRPDGVQVLWKLFCAIGILLDCWIRFLSNLVLYEESRLSIESLGTFWLRCGIQSSFRCCTFIFKYWEMRNVVNRFRLGRFLYLFDAAYLKLKQIGYHWKEVFLIGPNLAWSFS